MATSEAAPETSSSQSDPRPYGVRPRNWARHAERGQGYDGAHSSTCSQRTLPAK